LLLQPQSFKESRNGPAAFDPALEPRRDLARELEAVAGVAVEAAHRAFEGLALVGAERHRFAAGLAGASWDRRFHQGILAVFATIVAGFVLGIVAGPLSVVGLSLVRAIDYSGNMVGALDIPLPIMLVVGGAVGTVGAGLAAWSSHRSHPDTTLKSAKLSG